MSQIAGHMTEDARARVEVLPPDELPRAVVRWQPGQSGFEGRTWHVRPASLQRIVNKGPAEWKACDRASMAAARHRIAEWTALFGSLSSGICRLLLRAAEADADAQYFRARAELEDNDKMRSQADKRMTTSRQCELMAWEIACRETDRRPARPGSQVARLEADLAGGLDSDPSSALGPGGGVDAGAPTSRIDQNPTSHPSHSPPTRKRRSRKSAPKPPAADAQPGQDALSGNPAPPVPSTPEKRHRGRPRKPKLPEETP